MVGGMVLYPNSPFRQHLLAESFSTTPAFGHPFYIEGEFLFFPDGFAGEANSQFLENLVVHLVQHRCAVHLAAI